MEHNVKTTITLESLRNKKIIKICYYIIGLFLTFFTVSLVWVWDKTGVALFKEKEGIVSLISLVFVLLMSISLCFRTIKKAKLKEGYIDNRNFKIVEDKIYDRYMESYTDSDGHSHHSYYVFSKIYGEISIDKYMYDGIKKDDSILLLFYNHDEFILQYNNETDESIRNSKIIAQKYLASQYELSQELKMNFDSYDEKIGNEQFEKRIEKLKEELSSKTVTCKTCQTDYNLSKEKVCPKCSSVYKFDIIDVIHEKEWYK